MSYQQEIVGGYFLLVCPIYLCHIRYYMGIGGQKLMMKVGLALAFWYFFLHRTWLCMVPVFIFHCNGCCMHLILRKHWHTLCFMVVKDNVWRSIGEFGVSKSVECNNFPYNALTLLVGWQEGRLACKKLSVGLLMVMILRELCTSYSLSCHHHPYLQLSSEWSHCGTGLPGLTWKMAFKRVLLYCR